MLEGADHPRATGDGGKILANPCPKSSDDLLKYADWISEESRAVGKTNFDEEHSHSYGTDAGKDGESQFGDWRGIGILFARATHFSIENLSIIRSHGWGISLEDCSFGSIDHIDFDSCMAQEIDGLMNNTENQDGIDLRNGCHHITISNITGGTGDDLIALTAIADQRRPRNDQDRRDAIFRGKRCGILYNSVFYVVAFARQSLKASAVIVTCIISAKQFNQTSVCGHTVFS